MKVTLSLGVMVLLGNLLVAHATMLPISPEVHIRNASVIFEGTPYAEDVFRVENGTIYTEVHILVSRHHRGALPDRIRMRHPGGRIGNSGLVENQSPAFALGQHYLILAATRTDGTLYAVHGTAGVIEPPFGAYADILNATSPLYAWAGSGPDVRDQASDWPVPEVMPAARLTPTSNAFSARFPKVDRGEPLSYVIDMQALPTNVTELAAETAVERAVAAWEAASSARFVYKGSQVLGKSAALFSNSAPADVLIQMHDIHGHIPAGTTLGVGGRRYQSNTNLMPNGGTGGRIGTNEFDLMKSAYIVLNHEKGALSDLMTLEEVLTHELGHNLSLTHSSDDSGETNDLLREATMFFRSHEDGRGATVGTWDSNSVALAYPPGDTAPYGYERVMHILTSYPSSYPEASGLNRVTIPMYDLQEDSVTASKYSELLWNGSFTVASTGSVFYLPNGFFANTNWPPGNGGGFDSCYVRLSDGNNMSPLIQVRVVSFLEDDVPADGLPDLWATAHGLGVAGNADGDNFTDRQEWQLDTDPTNDASGLYLAVTTTGITWNARPYEVYELLSTTNISNGFARDRNPKTPTGSTGHAPITADEPGALFYRLRYIP